MKSLDGYFELIDGKTYIDKYPPSVIKLENLKNDSIFVEFGGGIGNDINFLINSFGLNPKNVYFLDIDNDAYKKAFKRLKDFFGLIDYHLLLRDARKSNLKGNFADFVYANNMLHDLENKKNILKILKEAFRVLKKDGLFFGRTLSNEINEEKFRKILEKKERKGYENFSIKIVKAMKDNILVGINPKELSRMAKKVGFKKTYTKIIPTKWAPTRDFYFKFEK
ncbi:MAG: methyltransferase domain-containing protein [Candidatus Aenigmarchaeota archaeon]|nr:methyltransferase domain-containing protein [Candidatus Aenigmarchaeota archaeon]